MNLNPKLLDDDAEMSDKATIIGVLVICLIGGIALWFHG